MFLEDNPFPAPAVCYCKVVVGGRSVLGLKSILQESDVRMEI